MTLTSLTTFSQDSTKFIDGYLVTETDTLACFTFQKVQEFAITKIELHECDSIMQRKDEIVNHYKSSLSMAEETILHLEEAVTLHKEHIKVLEKENALLERKIRWNKLFRNVGIAVGAGGVLYGILK